MRDLQIDFVRPGDRGQSSGGMLRVWLLVLAVSAALVVVGLIVGSGFADKAKRQQGEARDLLAERESVSAAARQQERVPADVVDSVNGVVRMLDYPNIDLLNQLERHARPNVAVLSVELGAVRANLRIVVQAAGMPEVLDYLEAIRGEPGFRDVVLSRQEANNTGDGQGGWRFTLETPQAEAVPRATVRNQRGQEG